MKKIIKFLILLLFITYVCLCGFVYFFPQKVFYKPFKHPSNLSLARKELPCLNEVKLSLPDNQKTLAWYCMPTTKNEFVVFYHGNSYNISYFLSRIKPFINAGYGVIIPEYIGFGGVSGKISQKNNEEVSLATVYFLNSIGFDNKNIILYGYSLGTFMATNTAYIHKSNPFDAVILEAPFTSLLETALETVYHLIPLSFLMNDTYPSIDKINQINTRLFIGHGQQDPTVPYKLGQKLFLTAKQPKTFFSVKEANHKNLPENGFFENV